jgi:pyridoxal phosphate enzyme (YggS family)
MEAELAIDVQANYRAVLRRVERAADRAGRDAHSIRVVVVTKLQPVDRIRAAIKAGARDFGENYAEEALPKMQALAGEGISWHMIGHVQSRKARLVVENFALMHSLDSLKLAERLDRFAAELGRVMPALLEFNVGGEASKFGWDASNEERWDELLPEMEAILALSHMRVLGLMTMPPLFSDPELTRPFFRKLAHLRDFLRKAFPHHPWEELSMGTSADFEVAIEEGATMVRIGEAILGPRPRVA